MVHGLSSNDLGVMFRLHSSTLRQLVLSDCQSIDSKTLQAIVVGCEALERLFVTLSIVSQNADVCLHLKDAIEFPWAWSRIRELQLTIAIPCQPLHHLADGVTVPYYNRPSPMTLSAGEAEQFQSLESFYQQIGALAELKRLDLHAVYFNPVDNRVVSGNYRYNTFPGMLSLGNGTTGGRPGYLQLLGGLTKIYGSFDRETEEAKATIGEDEEAWMKRHWQVTSEEIYW